MFNKIFPEVLSVSVLLLMSGNCLAAATVGNASASIFAGIDPNKCSYAVINPYDVNNIEVKLPDEAYSYYLGRPCISMPGWSAELGDIYGVEDFGIIVSGPDNLSYLFYQDDVNDPNYPYTLQKIVDEIRVDDFEYVNEAAFDAVWAGGGAAYGDEYRNLSGNSHWKANSMELQYYHVSPYTYSEAILEYDPAMDWSEKSVINLFFAGNIDNVADDMYVIVEDADANDATAYYDDVGFDVTDPNWHEWEIPLTEFSSSGVDLSKVKKFIVGMGDRDGSPTNAYGSMYFDDIYVEDAIAIFDYNDTDPNLLMRQSDGTDPNNLYITYSYDSNSCLESFTLHDKTGQSEVTREYDVVCDANHLALSLSQQGFSCSLCGGAGFGYEYQDANDPNDLELIQKVVDSNDNTVYEYEYDNKDRITYKYLGPKAGEVVIYEYDYDDDANCVDKYSHVDSSNYRVLREYIDPNSGLVEKRITFEELNEDPDDPSGESYVEHIIYYYAPTGIDEKVVIPPSADFENPPDPISGVRKEYTYDPNTGSVLAEDWFDVNDANFIASEYTYDNIPLDPADSNVVESRIETYTDALGAVTTYFYDGNDSDPNFKTMPQVTTGVSGTQQLSYRYTYDGRNRLSFEEQLDDSSSVVAKTGYEYDNFGNLILGREYLAPASNDSNQVTEYTYNGFNQKIKTKLPSGVVQGWEYYDNGRLRSELVYDVNDPNYAYSQATYTYDPNGMVENIARAVDTGRFQIDSPAGWVYTEYEYDLEGNRTKIIEDANALDLETTYEYNLQGEVEKVTLPTGKWTKTYRDGRGLVSKTEVGYDSTVVATTEYEYDLNGNLTKETADNGISTEYEYDDFDRLIKVTRGK